MKKSDSITEINKALVNFRKEVKQPKKDAKNPFFKSSYTTLDTVIETIDNTAPNYGLSFVQYPTNNENNEIGMITMLLHESGEFMEFDPVFMKPEKNTPQAAGSVISYLRRYTISSIFGITSDEDDDGNQATGNKTQKRTQKQDSGKLQLVKTNADVLAKILTSKGNEQTRQDIINAYTQEANLNDFSNEQLTQLADRIKAKVEKYKKEDNEK